MTVDRPRVCTHGDSFNVDRRLAMSGEIVDMMQDASALNVCNTSMAVMCVRNDRSLPRRTLIVYYTLPCSARLRQTLGPRQFEG